MENVFDNLYPTISSKFSTEEKVPVHKRHAFIFITAEPDSSSIALEDLKNIEGVVEIILRMELMILLRRLQENH